MYKKSSYIAVWSIFSVLLLLIALKAYYERQPDSRLFFSGDVTWLGNPLADRWPVGEDIYARNIWDLQKYKGRIYIGSGNSANSAPAVNAGPIDIWSYDPKADVFIKEGRVNDEQIDVFKIINGELFIPGHDAASPDDWEFGNYYQKTAEKWIKYRRIPKGIHVYDMMAYQNKLFAALGSHGFKSAIAVSEDKGETWQTTPVGFYRFYTLFELNGKLYATGIFRTSELTQRIIKKRPKQKEDIPYALYEYQQGKMQAVDLGIDDLFPDWSHARAIFRKPTHFKQALVYLAALPSNDHQYLEQSLYAMQDIGHSSKLNFPKGFIPQDVVRDNGRLLILATQKEQGENKGGNINKRNYKNTVFETTDLERWKPLMHFEADTFARSFETMDGCFYFGMGTDVQETGKWWPKWKLSPLTGSILKSQCELTNFEVKQ